MQRVTRPPAKTTAAMDAAADTIKKTAAMDAAADTMDAATIPTTTADTSSTKNFILFVVYFQIVLYAFCFQLQRPLEPFLVDQLVKAEGARAGAGAIEDGIVAVEDNQMRYAKLQSFFSFIQTIGSLLGGLLLDKFGARMGFAINFIASALSYYILSQTSSMETLYLSKVPTVFMMGFLCAQTLITQITRPGAERIAALGRLTMSYTIGMVIGPSLGGILGADGSKESYFLAAKIAAFGSLLSAALCVLLPAGVLTNAEGAALASVSASASTSAVATVVKKQKGETNDGSENSCGASVAVFTRIIALVGHFLATKFVSSVANSMRESAGTLILKNQYQFNEKQLGFTMAAGSALNSIFNGFLLGPIAKLLDEDLTKIIRISIGSVTALAAVQTVFSLPLFAIPSLGNGLYVYIACTFAMTVFQFLLATTITGESTSKVAEGERGSLLGLEHSIFAVARIGAPTWGAALLSWGGITAVTGACGMLYGSVFLWWVFFFKVDASSPTGVKEAISLEDRTTATKERGAVTRNGGANRKLASGSDSDNNSSDSEQERSKFINRDRRK